jgi:ATP-dependent protease ClpP protease subunit
MKRILVAAKLHRGKCVTHSRILTHEPPGGSRNVFGDLQKDADCIITRFQFF